MQALDAGVDDYLVKPFSVDELLARLRALQRRRWQAEPSVSDELLLFDGMQINLTAGVVHVGDQRLDLLSKEYVLLLALARAAGRASTAPALFGAVWSDLTTPPQDLLEVYLDSLQRKLTAAGGPVVRCSSGAKAWTLVAAPLD